MSEYVHYIYTILGHAVKSGGRRVMARPVVVCVYVGGRECEMNVFVGVCMDEEKNSHKSVW